MNKQKLKLMKPIKLIISLSLTLCLIPLTGKAQTADSISLKSILNQVTTNYPAIRKVEQDMNAANARIGLAKSGYLPNIDITSSYTHIGPSSSIDFPGLGAFELYPVDNYSASLNYSQSIYDFGRTAKNIAMEKQGKGIVSLSAEQLKQRLSLGVVNLYYSIVFLQEAVKIKDEQLFTLNQHLLFVQKKKETGSATQYEVLTTKVRISATENQKTDLLNSLKVQICQLNLLLGQPEKTTLVVKKELQAVLVINSTDSLLTVATKTRKELQIAQQKTDMASLRLKVVGTQNNPSFNFYASGGIKDGYEPKLYNGIWNYAVGVGLKIPLYDGNHTKYNQLQVQADIQSDKEDIELARRNIVNEVVESQANMQSALQKISQSELQLQQAKDAYALAETSFKSGVITNLELLDSSTSLSEAGLSKLKSNIDYSLSLFKLKLALGEQIY